MEGFGRILDNQGNVQQGFYSTAQGRLEGEAEPRSRPFGKWMQINAGVKVNVPGVYRGTVEEWNQIVYTNDFKDLVSNIDPTKPRELPKA